MIEVRIRHYTDADGWHLCEWDADRLDELIPTLGRWGIHTDLGDWMTEHLSAQIVVTEREAFFEVLINNDESS